MQPVCEDFFPDERAGAPVSRALNEATAAYLEAMRAHVLALHDGGARGSVVNDAHAEGIDRLIRRLFRVAENAFFEEHPRLASFGMAVVAVGGYGRRELSLGSDIDLLFIYRGKVNAYVETLAETITHRLWDAGLTVGHATRTITECMRFGRQDLPTLTSYLDARFLIGDLALFAELERDVRGYIRKNALAFVEGKLEEQAQRHAKMGESLFLLQPNIKESVGGLRDHHTAMWTARAAQWAVRTPEDLRKHAFVEEGEVAELVEALEFVWRIRNELQRAARKGDRLHYEAQERLVALFGLEDTPEQTAPEQLMRDYYLHAKAIHRVSTGVQERALQLVDRRRTRLARSAYLVSDGFAIVDGKLEIPRASLLQERPQRLLSAFAVAQHHDVDLSPRAQALVHEHVPLIDDAFRCDPEAARIFRQILSSPIRVYRTLRAINEAGLLGAYIPEWEHLFGLWQQDMYHTYTVDVHSLFLVEQLRRIRKGNHADDLPLATELMRDLEQPFAVYLGCLLHDIGKGYGGGHCVKGAKMIPPVAERLHLDEEEAEIVDFIVLHHLTMSGMADRRDVNDPRTIQNLATLCLTRERLRVLYLSTVADIRSVSPEAWTTWKHSQLTVLYRNTAEWLEASEGDASQFFLERAMTRAEENQAGALELLGAAGGDPEQARALLEAMPRRYVLDHNAQEIAQHLSMALDFMRSGRDVGVYSFRPGETPEGFWGVVVLGRDRPGLFSRVAGVLTACGHDVLRASVYTTRGGLALEIYQVAPIAGGEPEEASERQRIGRRLDSALEGDERPPVRRVRTEVPDGAVRVRAPRVLISNGASDFYTVIDVSTNDRPGLLHEVTTALSELGLDIEMSRASTRARRAIDAFYVSQHGQKVTDERRCKEIETALLEVLARSEGA